MRPNPQRKAAPTPRLGRRSPHPQVPAPRAGQYLAGPALSWSHSVIALGARCALDPPNWRASGTSACGVRAAPELAVVFADRVPAGAGVAACQQSAGTPRRMRLVAPGACACSSAMPVMTVPCASPPWGCAWCAAGSAGRASRCRRCAAGSGPRRPPPAPSGRWPGWRRGRRSPWRCRRTRGR